MIATSARDIPEPVLSENFRQVAVIGLGYIGLPTATVLAARGVTVLGVDVNSHVVQTINAGNVHLVEPGLPEAVAAVVASGRLRAATRPEPSDAFIIAVPTPFKDGHEPDLRHVEAAARAIAQVLAPSNLVVLESTSPPGTTERVMDILRSERPDLAIADGTTDAVLLAYCPERVLPGRILEELVENDRVIGGLDAAGALRAAELYGLFVHGECLLTDARTAELVKLSENAYRDVNIAFANELSRVADRVGVDVWQVIALANRHPRVNVLQPGPGVGGHCISVDPWFIVHAAPDDARLIRAAREVNDEQPHRVAAQALERLAGVDQPVVACLGLSYKADIDDLRESPAVQIARLLADAGAHVLAVEPHVEELPPELADRMDVALCDLEPALDKADLVLLLVDHTAFRAVDVASLRAKVLDTRGLWR